MASPSDAKLKAQALQDPSLRRLVDAWLAGARITDEQYLHLRSQALDHWDDPAANVWGYLLVNFLGHLAVRYGVDAVCYYYGRPVDPREINDGWRTAFEGAIIVPREDVVAKDLGTPVWSHFERLFCDVFKLALWGLWGIELLELPEQSKAFKHELEDEWTRVLHFGNGHFGLTVIPRVCILDMVRYQQLGGGDKLVSWSIANYIIWQMDSFPPAMQLLFPRFREVAFRRRLVGMFDPLVESVATETAYRQQWTKTDAPLGRDSLVEEFQRVVAAAIEEYDFMHGKEGTAVDAVGMLGLESSPWGRQRVDARLAQLGIPIKATDLCHVGLAHFVKTRLRDHLREHFPVQALDSAARHSLDAPGEGEDEDTTLADTIPAPDDRGEGVSSQAYSNLETWPTSGCWAGANMVGAEL